ncbi:MAG: class I SAM-dependent methyltransferase [Rhodospirillales bacterium]|nr:class I SAM-dependent methyltransferase [Rhodospirillales bacterium]
MAPAQPSAVRGSADNASEAAPPARPPATRQAGGAYQKARTIVLRQFGTGKIGAEIGVFKGDFSRQILDQAKPAKLYLIDPWENIYDPGLSKSWYAAGSPNDMPSLYDAVQKRFEPEIAAGQVELCRGFSADAMARFDDNSLDFAYVDGDHRFEGVSADLELAFAKVRPGGVIAADDHKLGGWWADGVVRALNEFAGRHASGVQIVYAHFSQIVLRKLG